MDLAVKTNNISIDLSFDSDEKIQLEVTIDEIILKLSVAHYKPYWFNSKTFLFPRFCEEFLKKYV